MPVLHIQYVCLLLAVSVLTTPATQPHRSDIKFTPPDYINNSNFSSVF